MRGQFTNAVVAAWRNLNVDPSTLATDQGRPGLRLVVLPFSLHTLAEEEVRASARALLPLLLEQLGASATQPALPA